MVRKWSNQNIPGALHYITGNFLDRQRVFTHDRDFNAFIEPCAKLLKDWPCKLIAYVLMPDHLHMIVNPKDGNIIDFTWRLKGLAAKSLVKVSPPSRFRVDGLGNHQVWQESFKAVPLWSAWMIWQKINYIHLNPVKAKLVKSAKDYHWSSFREFYGLEEGPLSLARDWWWPDDAEKLSKAMKELGWRTYHNRS